MNQDLSKYLVKSPSTSGRSPLDQYRSYQSPLSQSKERQDKLREEARVAEEESQKLNSPLSIAGQTARGALSSVADTGIKFLGSAIKAPIDIGSELLGGTVDTEAKLPGFAGPQKTIQGEFRSETIPKVESGEESSLSATTKTVGKTLQGGLDVLGGVGVGQAIKTGIKKIPTLLGSIGEKTGISNYLNKQAENKSIDFALKLTAPKLTPKVGAEGIEQGRMISPGFLKPAKLAPSANDNLVADSVVDVVSPNKSVAENVDLIKQRVSQIDSGVENMIATNKVPFNAAQLRSRLNKNKEESRLIFASDANAEKVYSAVVDEFMRNVRSGDTLGLFRARKTFDQIPAIKKLLDSEGLGENVKRQIVLDVRRAANEYVSDLLPSNNPYRSALKQESRMIEALGNIAETNAKTLGKNKIQLLTQEYPILKWVVSGLAGAAGIGVGGTIIDSSN